MLPAMPVEACVDFWSRMTQQSFVPGAQAARTTQPAEPRALIEILFDLVEAEPLTYVRPVSMAVMLEVVVPP